MRIEVKAGNIVCVAEAWKGIEANERKFLNDCYWTAIWTGFDESGALVFNPSGDARSKLSRINSIKYYAANNNIEVSDDVEAIRASLQEEAKTLKAREEAARLAEIKKLQWKSRQESGCGDCRYSLQVGDGWFRCQYSGEELDSKFMEQYNPKIQAMELFHEVGVPNEHCKDYVKEEIKVFGGAK